MRCTCSSLSQLTQRFCSVSLILAAQNIMDETLLDCQYSHPPFPDIDREDPAFLKDDDKLTKVV